MNEKEKPWISPLQNFESDIGRVQKVRLNKRICLRYIDDEEVRKLKEIMEKVHGTEGTLAAHKVTYVLESNIKNFLDYIERITLTLRLLKAGDVEASHIYRLEEKGYTVIGNARFGFTPPERIYSLKDEEISNFKKLWTKVLHIDSKQHLLFPLKTFNSACEKRQHEDKIVDCVTALESLIFLGEDKSIEPAGKIIGIAIGMLIGKNQEERNAIKERIAKAYEIRNAKVHGNIQKLEKYEWQGVKQLSIEVEDYLRYTLRKFVEE